MRPAEHSFELGSRQHLSVTPNSSTRQRSHSSSVLREVSRPDQYRLVRFRRCGQLSCRAGLLRPALVAWSGFNINYTYARILDNAVGMSNQTPRLTVIGFPSAIATTMETAISIFGIAASRAIIYALPLPGMRLGFKGEAL